MSAPTKEQIEAVRHVRVEDHFGLPDNVLQLLVTAQAALEAAEADSARLDWLQHQLQIMDSQARGTWLRIGDKGRVQVHRYPPHAMSVWDDAECVMDSITEYGTNDVREALDAARKEAQP